MEKRRLYQIVSILLIPYLDERVMSFATDPVANVRYAFYRLSHRQDKSENAKQDLHRAYEKAEKNLELFLQKRQDLMIRSVDDFRMLTEHCFPERKIVRLYNQFDPQGRAPLEVIDWYYYDQIFHISNSLLTFRDGRVAIKTWFTENDDLDQFRYPNVFDKVEIWNLIGRIMTPDTLIAAYFISCGRTDIYNLFQQQGNIFLADKTLEGIYRKGLAETHLHFNAGMDFRFLWAEESDLRNWNIEEERSFPIEAAVYRFVWAAYVEFSLEHDTGCGLKDFIESNYGKAAEEIKKIIRCLYYNRPYEGKEELAVVITELLYTVDDKDTQDLFMGNLYQKYKGLNTSAEMIFLFRTMLYFRCGHAVKRAENAELHLFLQYIRHKNRVYGQVVKSNQILGLANFRSFYGQMSRREFRYFRDVRTRGELIFRSVLINSYLKKLEIRVVPRMDFTYFRDMDKSSLVHRDLKIKMLGIVSNILEAYLTVLQDSLGMKDENTSDGEFWKRCDYDFRDNRNCAPTLGIIFHFLKRNDVDNRIADTCWLSMQESNPIGRQHILAFRESMIRSACAIEELRGEIPLLAEYVVGIDVASEEVRSEPWVYAQIYHQARNRMITRPVLNAGDKVSRINNMGFTFHVGEEFRHILTGLRHIDEVVWNFHYKAGDRLGHATALGVSLDYWMRSNEAVVMPVLEYMEDLIWLWGNMVNRNWGLQINVEALEGRILSLAKRIYGNLNGINVYMLYEAYRMKFGDDYQRIFKDTAKTCILDGISDLDLEQSGLSEHFCRNYDQNSRSGSMWTAEKLFCTYFCPVYNQLYSEPIIVPVEAVEKPLFETVQENIRKEVEKQGIYIETNPTSNLSIGEQESIFSHHIFTLNSRGLKEGNESRQVMVSVNTDNPIIFSTNIENELAYVYHSLIHIGYGRESVLEWIDKVRRMGMNSSFVKTVKKPSQQYREIRELLKYIEEYTNTFGKDDSN